MSTIRPEVLQLKELGTISNAVAGDVEKLRVQDEMLRTITRPVSDAEAEVLVQLFGEGDCRGMAWLLVHLIESVPGWPIETCLKQPSNEWTRLLHERAIRAGRLK